MSLQLNGTDGVTFNDGSEQWAAASPIGTKNLIINGDMRIAQRGTSATGLGNNDTGYYTVDRWGIWENGSPTYEFTQTQDTDVPSGQGFANSLKMSCTTADATLSADDAFAFRYKIEGQMLQHLKYGTSNAEQITMSFWVKSNKTGTYIVNPWASSEISKAYTIDSADTWEKKTITFDANTIDTIANDNATGLTIYMYMLAGTDRTSGTLNTTWSALTSANRAVGQVNLADSTSNYINITGVQLEVGDTATPFEYVPYDMNLARCQRYYAQSVQGTSFNTNASGAAIVSRPVYSNFVSTGAYYFPVTMRAAPTVTIYNTSTGSSGSVRLQSTATNITAVADRIGENGFSGIYCSGNNFTATDFAFIPWKAEIEL